MLGRRVVLVQAFARAVLLGPLVFLFSGFVFGTAAQGVAIQAENVISQPIRAMQGRVEVGRWSQDERGRTLRTQVEEWFTEDFGFPLRVKRTFRMTGHGGEETTELRNIVRMTDSEREQRFRSNKDWKEVDGEVQRLNTSRMGFFDREAKYGATTRIGRRSDRRPQSRDPFSQGRLGSP